MIAGDGDNDGKVEYVDTWMTIEIAPGVFYDFPVEYGDDYDLWATSAGMAGYLPADYSLNGQVQNSDKNDLMAPNDGLVSTVIPEPGTMIVWGLLGLVAAGYGVWRRRRAG